MEPLTAQLGIASCMVIGMAFVVRWLVNRMDAKETSLTAATAALLAGCEKREAYLAARIQQVENDQKADRNGIIADNTAATNRQIEASNRQAEAIEKLCEKYGSGSHRRLDDT